MKYFVTERLSENMSETPEGFLLCIGVPITRTGVLKYAPDEVDIEPGEDGLVNITRSPDDIFNSKTMSSFEGKPVTIDHPEDFVTPENWKELTVGITQNVRKGDEDNADKLLADFLITDADAISLVKGGLREVSCGYEAGYLQTGKGEGRQVDIRGNHNALVKNGRAGPSCAIHDSKENVMSKEQKEKAKKTFVDKMKDAAAKIFDESIATEQGSVDSKEGNKDAKSCDDATLAAIDAAVKKAMDDYSGGEEAETADDEDDVDTTDKSKAMDDRMKAMEDAIAKLQGTVDSDANGEEGEESDDDEEDEEDEDDGEVIGDSADFVSRLEILAPGLDSAAKNVKARALKTFYKTEDGKKIINALSGGKATKATFDSANTVDTLFIAASEVVKSKRSGDLAATKAFDKSKVKDHGEAKPLSAEEQNAKNQAFWEARKKN